MDRAQRPKSLIIYSGFLFFVNILPTTPTVVSDTQILEEGERPLKKI